MKNLNLALIVACVTAICLNAEVLTKTAEISLGGKKVGKIEVLTPVEVIAKEGAKAKIKLGWVVFFDDKGVVDLLRRVSPLDTKDE